LRFLSLARLALLTAAVATFVFPGSASAAHIQCGDTITHDTTLDSNLSCSGVGLTIGAAVTVDFAGHVLHGAGGGVGVMLGYPAPSDFSGAEVRNGTIRNFAYGVAADGPQGTLVHRMLLEGNAAAGFHCNYAPECTVHSSVVRGNGTGVRFEAVDAGCRSGSHVRGNSIYGNAVGVWMAGCNGTVNDNRILRNSSRGVVIEDHGRVEVSRNVISGNGAEGVHAIYLATVGVSHNRIVTNGGDGVHLDGGIGPYAPGGTVRHNRIAGNGGDGVHTTGVWDSDTTIERNRAERNGDDGIDVDIGEYGGPITVRANRAFFNGDLGIEADPGTIDGGGNRASHNGNPAQCVGVRCR
jgi:parallel beta-helix repeat protein